MQLIGYACFFISLLYCFLLWQFPYESLRREIVKGFEENVPLNLTIGKVGPSFPFTLRLQDIRISSGTVSVQIPDMKVKPDLLGFLRGDAGYGLVDAENPERLLGEYRLVKDQNTLRIRGKEMAIQTSSRKEFSLQVSLSGEANLKWVGESLEKGDGQIWVLLKKNVLQAESNYKLPEFLTAFDSVRAELQVKNGAVALKRLEASGKNNLARSFQGDFQLAGPGRGGLPDLGVLFQLIPKQ
jgi:type II secretion system protein N